MFGNVNFQYNTSEIYIVSIQANIVGARGLALQLLGIALEHKSLNRFTIFFSP